MQRDAINVKLKWRSEGGTRVTAIGNWLDVPLAQDPLGLTRSEYDANPRTTTSAALQFDTRKSYAQSQAGLVIEHDVVPGHALRFTGYTGKRTVLQYQSIAVAAQSPPTHPGGVIDLERSYHGLDARYIWRTTIPARALTMVVGANTDQQDEHRRGFQNFVGPALGVLGALRRDEDNRVRNTDAYANSELDLASTVTLTAGVRTSAVRFRSKDRYVVTGNPDDSGGVSYRKTTPALGMAFRPTPSLNVYAAWGRGFETPTFNELAYRPGGQSGLNFALQPSVSDSAEVGVKWRSGGGRLNLALFDTRTDNELAVLTNSGGRATFQNVGATRRRGAEFALQWRGAESLEFNLTATYLDARYRDTFSTCVAIPCTAPATVVPTGNRLPAIARTSAYAELEWKLAHGWTAALEAKYQDRVYVNDLNTDAAAQYVVASARISYEWQARELRLRAGVRAENLLDKNYAATVIVNEASGRYFEPAPGRNLLATLSVQYGF